MRPAAGSGIVQRFLAFLRAYELAGETVGIAFSGGPDSTALAIAASEAARAQLLRPVALHIDHGVRSDSAADLETVIRTCTKLGLDLKCLEANLPATASEGAMRDARYQLLASAVGEIDCNVVMTAHHAGDQAETVLLHLLRGSGPEGVAGMASIEHMSIGKFPPGLVVVRPFLAETRAELLQLVESVGLPYLVDPTNADRDKARNALRLDILPRLELMRPGAAAAIARFAEIARDEHEALRQVADAAAAKHVEAANLTVRTLRTEPVAIQRRVIRQWVRNRTGLELSWNRTEALRVAMVSERGGTIVELGERWSASRKGGAICLTQTTGSEG